MVISISSSEHLTSVPAQMFTGLHQTSYRLPTSLVLKCFVPLPWQEGMVHVYKAFKSRRGFFLPNKKSRTTWNVARLTTHKPNRRRVCHAQFYDQLDGKPIDFSRGMDSL